MVGVATRQDAVDGWMTDWVHLHIFLQVPGPGGCVDVGLSRRGDEGQRVRSCPHHLAVFLMEGLNGVREPSTDEVVHPWQSRDGVETGAWKPGEWVKPYTVYGYEATGGKSLRQVSVKTMSQYRAQFTCQREYDEEKQLNPTEL